VDGGRSAEQRRMIQPRWREIMERAADLNPRDPYVIQNRRLLENR